MHDHASDLSAAGSRARRWRGQPKPSSTRWARQLLFPIRGRQIRRSLRTVILTLGMLFIAALCRGDCRLPVARTLGDDHYWPAIAGRGWDLPDPWVSDLPAVRPRAASGATVTFWTQNGQTVNGVRPRMTDLPHLVLYRNGTLTGPDERTIIVEASGIRVPPRGVTVTLAVMTQHPDPDKPSAGTGRIVVAREPQRVAGRRVATREDGTTIFSLVFTETVTSGGTGIPTPTDYFRVEVTVGDDTFSASPQGIGLDYAFLMENQVIARLPDVPEQSPGAAPDELIVHYCDMFPFGSGTHDLSSRPYRREVPSFVQHELVPQMVEAYRVQTQEWGFAWADAWTSLRLEDGEERLSVALSDSQTWYHGWAPDIGHNQISLEVSGYRGMYDTLIDGLVSTFHHELFHNLQRSIQQTHTSDGYLGGQDRAWRFFSEGTAVLASSVGRSRAHFTRSGTRSRYMLDANFFVIWNTYSYAYAMVTPNSVCWLPSPDPKSYTTMNPYYAGMFWRFLYERCGGMSAGVENPAAGMRVIRQALVALYSGEIVDIAESTDLVVHLPALMDRALVDTACPFETYEESLVHLSRAIYALRLEGGRCTAPGLPAGCGLYDPDDLYMKPMVRTITYTGADQRYPMAIRSSFGMAFVDVLFHPAVDGQTLTIELVGALEGEARFNVQIWKLTDAGPSGRPQRIPAQLAGPEVLTDEDADGRLVAAIPTIDLAEVNRLGLIITRIDARESVDPVGGYSIRLRPGPDVPPCGAVSGSPGSTAAEPVE